MGKCANIKKILSTIVFITLLVVICSGLTPIFTGNLNNTANASAELNNSENEIYYTGDPNYGDARGYTTSTETINYATKQSVGYLINSSFPNYFNTNSSLNNTCANVAGANILGYYDRFYDTFIPDYTPGYQGTNNYIYYGMSVNQAKKQSVIDSLYLSMSTNNPNAGTSQAQYRAGLYSYVNSKGKVATSTSVMSNDSIDINKVIIQFNSGNPVSLYFCGYTLTRVTDTGSTVTLNNSSYIPNHIAIAYGYNVVEYYDAQGYFIKTKIYLNISPGVQSAGEYYVVGTKGMLYNAEGLHVQ
ncbi:MAG: hypothetical protein RSB20_03520 [Clostridia bacterium]